MASILVLVLNESDRVLVTGASSGIGEATVRALRTRGVPVVAAARRIDRLTELSAETGCEAIDLDVTDRDAVSSLAGESFTAVVNNAGLGRAMGSFLDATDDDIDRTLGTNVTGLIALTRAVLPSMVEARRGHVVNVGSMAGHHRLPAALYGASKAAVAVFSADLRLEFQGTGVRVTEIAPGRVATEFYDAALDDPAARAAAKDSGIADVTAADVADSVLFALDAPRRVNINLIEIQPTEQTYGGWQFVPGPISEESR